MKEWFWKRLRPTSKQLGDLGEDLAVRFLRRRGYQILKRGYRLKFGEVDIVAKDKDTLVFVEVRSRTESEYGFASESINIEKRRRIAKAAIAFQARYGLLDYNSRFDCVFITFGADKKVKNTELIKDAFWR